MSKIVITIDVDSDDTMDVGIIRDATVGAIESMVGMGYLMSTVSSEVQ